MPRVVTDPCKGKKHGDCVDVCPTDCFYEVDDMLVINPDDCTDCGACQDECPTHAILPDDEADDKWTQFNAAADFSKIKHILSKDQITR